MNLSPKNLIKLLEQRGWILKRINGSHHIYYNHETKQTLPIPVHGNKDLGIGLFLSILDKTGITIDEITNQKKGKKLK